MHLRQDALAAAAEFIVFVESYAKARAPLVATVGTITVPSGASNVIAGETMVSLDVRHPSDRKCNEALAALLKRAQEIARVRGLTCMWQKTMQHPSTGCSRDLTKLLRQSVRSVQSRDIALVSGAGHDAVVMAKLTPVAMLFVRCRDGLSHHPDEYASPADLETALRVLIDFIERLATRKHA